MKELMTQETQKVICRRVFNGKAVGHLLTSAWVKVECPYSSTGGKVERSETSKMSPKRTSLKEFSLIIIN